jgi:hypothetical protein
LSITIAVADTLGLGVDLTLGTGWPYGGKKCLATGGRKKNFCMKAESVKIITTQQKVKRAAPGGEGLVLDHFDSTALGKLSQTFQWFCQHLN